MIRQKSRCAIYVDPFIIRTSLRYNCTLHLTDVSPFSLEFFFNHVINVNLLKIFHS